MASRGTLALSPERDAEGGGRSEGKGREEGKEGDYPTWDDVERLKKEVDGRRQ